uniref:Uncharacterized protein LOC111123755 isoform X2 n=1 Tax=Crassostrea virginica TaxID=6565 RepID=A0A8B8D3C4_CRAVI|nr:uncharacterized protein LOC111123755 isoform X2 [Crassostrea virginica]
MEYPEINNEKTIKELTDRLSGLIKESSELETTIDGLGAFYTPTLNFSQTIQNKVIAIRNYISRYERTLNKPVQFLRFIKRFPLSKTQESKKNPEPYKYVMKQRSVKQWSVECERCFMDYPKLRKRKNFIENCNRLSKKMQKLQQSVDNQNFPNKIRQNVGIIQNYDRTYAFSANRPVKFLRFIKRFPLSKVKNIPKAPEPYKSRGRIEQNPTDIEISPNDTSIYEFSTLFPRLKFWGIPDTFILRPDVTKRFNAFPLKINMENTIELLYDYQTRRQEERKKKLLPYESLPVLRESFIVPGTENCVDICFVPPNLFWVNNGNNLILTNTHGQVLHRVSCSYSCTANTFKMLYIDSDLCIQELSHQTKESKLLIKRPSSWLPLGVHCCPSNGDLLVGMISFTSYPRKAKVVRYNLLGEIKQSIYQNREGRVLYGYPRYIAENTNKDIVVSDVKRGRIVVTNHKGEFRFVLSVNDPRGICTDRLSRILVCRYTNDILVLDENGLFLLYLRIEDSPGIVTTRFKNVQTMFFQTRRPYCSQRRRTGLCLSYDDHNDLLWVGSNDSNTVSGYKVFKEGRQKQTDDFNKFHGILRFVDIFLRICFFFIHLIFKLTVEIWSLLRLNSHPYPSMHCVEFGLN